MYVWRPGKYSLDIFLTIFLQKTHEEIAEEKQLHLVEMCKESGFFPNVVASPAKCRTKAEVDKDEILDFTQYSLGGKVIRKKKKFPPFYTNTPGYLTYLKKQENARNQDKVKMQLLTEYGEIRSFLADKYPECRAYRRVKEQKEEEAEA